MDRYPSTTPKRPVRTEQPVILIIDDDPDLAGMYAEKFKLEGFNALIAYDGESGLDLAINKNPDAILLDILLPKDHGLSVLTKLREHPRGKHIPVIALSNLTSRERANEALKLGAKEYLAKAMHSPEEVVEKVKNHLGKV